MVSGTSLVLDLDESPSARKTNGFVVPRYDGEDEEDQVREWFMNAVHRFNSLWTNFKNWYSAKEVDDPEFKKGVMELKHNGVLESESEGNCVIIEASWEALKGVLKVEFQQIIMEMEYKTRRKSLRERLREYRRCSKTLKSVYSPEFTAKKMMQEKLEKKSLKAPKGIEDCT
ncbi:hypothetical protein SELMODRAFT_412262 [Selaginella moellendorffii]|uniref:Uncharacterized protein n=1 Tax=Selaginella moellendorffii TaxID=88036 RepID=D8RKK9_SELML|nr:hypothetical protein SELMODRAFT_412262 [Selaginella moellendorffii]